VNGKSGIVVNDESRILHKEFRLIGPIRDAIAYRLFGFRLLRLRFRFRSVSAVSLVARHQCQSRSEYD
jgi:hypothetical protein